MGVLQTDGGLQDNGSWGGPSANRGTRGPQTSDWFVVGGGDGFICQPLRGHVSVPRWTPGDIVQPDIVGSGVTEGEVVVSLGAPADAYLQARYAAETRL